MALEDLPINVVDLGAIVILLLSALLAFARGIVHEVFSIAAWVGAVLAALYGFPYARPLARDLIENQLIADIVAGAVLFLVALLVLGWLTSFISRNVQESGAGGLDRAFGFLFGLARGFLILCLLYLVALWTIERKNFPQYLLEARALPLVEPAAHSILGFVVSFLPEDAQDQIPQNESGSGSRIQMEDLTAPKARATGDGTDQGETGYDEKSRDGMGDLMQKSQ